MFALTNLVWFISHKTHMFQQQFNCTAFFFREQFKHFDCLGFDFGNNEEDRLI